ncbi:MAG: group 1 glycosyl transferase [Nitrospirae bacterium]|nr:MAG: group 1 glycosyl transferase [Nitrospirota bacterium]
MPKLNATHAGSRGVTQVIKELSREHEIYLVTRAEEIELDDVEEIRKYCKEIYLFPYKRIRNRNLLTILRIILSFLQYGLRVNKIVAANKFDIMHAEWVESAILLRKKQIPMILVANDVLTKVSERRLLASKGLSRALNYLEYFLIKKLEIYCVRKFDFVFTRSDSDKDYLLKMDPKLKVSFLPPPAGFNFVDKKVDREENVILFLGSFRDHDLNIKSVLYFYNKIFPLIKSRITNVKLYIVGYGPTKEILEIPEKDKNVIVTGFIEDIESYYKKATVFVAPILIGGGIITKILDAMAAGTPVVSTRFGNEGIGATDNLNILLADSPLDFADGVIRLLTDKELWMRISKESHVFVSKKFTLEVLKDILNDTYRDVLNDTYK